MDIEPPPSSASASASSSSSSQLPLFTSLSSSSSSPSSSVSNEVHALQGHTGRIFSLALAKSNYDDNRRIAASASHDRTVRIWDLENKALISVLQYPDFVWRVFFMHSTAASKIFIVAFISTVEKIYVTDIETGEHVRVIDGRLMFSGTMFIPQAILSAADAPSSSSSSPPPPPSSSSSPSSRLDNDLVTKVDTVSRPMKVSVLVVSLDDDHVAFIDGESGRVIFVLWDTVAFKKVFRATVSHREKPVLVITTWNSNTRRSTIETCNVSDYDNDSDDIHDSHEDHLISSKVEGISSDKFYKCKSFVLFEGDSRDGVTSVAISSSLKNELLCSGHHDCVVRVWDLFGHQLLYCLEGHSDFVVSVAMWREHEPILMSGSSDGTIRVWDLSTYNLITTCEGHSRDVWSVGATVGPDPLIVSASSDRSVRLWDINHILTDIKWNRQRHFLAYLKEEFKDSGAATWIHSYENSFIGIRNNKSINFNHNGDDNNNDNDNNKHNDNDNNNDNNNNNDNDTNNDTDHDTDNDNNNDNDTSNDTSNDTNNDTSNDTNNDNNNNNNNNKNRGLVLQSQNLCREILSFL